MKEYNALIHDTGKTRLYTTPAYIQYAPWRGSFELVEMLQELEALCGTLVPYYR